MTTNTIETNTNDTHDKNDFRTKLIEAVENMNSRGYVRRPEILAIARIKSSDYSLYRSGRSKSQNVAKKLIKVMPELLRQEEELTNLITHAAGKQ